MTDVADAVVVRELEHKIKCPHCRGGWLTLVRDSRPGRIHGMDSVRRRRVCGNCGTRTTTYEIIGEVFTRMFTTQNAKQVFAMKIVDMINDEVRAELTRRLDHDYTNTGIDRH